MRKGWLQHLRSSIWMFISLGRLLPFSDCIKKPWLRSKMALAASKHKGRVNKEVKRVVWVIKKRQHKLPIRDNNFKSALPKVYRSCV